MNSPFRKNPLIRAVQLAVLTSILTTSAAAQEHTPLTMKEAAQAAVLNSPEVLARWHAFREATEEVSVAKGGFMPRLDLTAGVGRETLKQPSAGVDSKYTRRDHGLTLNQMLFDGFATSSDVKRLGRAKLVRYFELLDTSETIALEAARAYLDVARFRELAALAEENYAEHYAAHENLKKRAGSGVGKRVDEEQAASRLALADVNLTTTYANLHDVTARYVRIVGTQPPKSLAAPNRSAPTDLPPTVDGALQVGLQRNPALRSTIENIESAQHEIEGRRAAFMPRVDARASTGTINNNLGVSGDRDSTVVEVLLNYNLFNGGADSARGRQSRERKNIALDQREKACRDMRQTLSIAYNESLRLKEQLPQIATQVALVEKTRAAYRDQFNIQQRTLLDLLNTQNEYFDARRSQVNADADLSLAYLRSYAGMGRLLEHLGLKQVDQENSPVDQELTSVDASQLCPAMAPMDAHVDRDALNRKAMAAVDKNRSLLPVRAPAPLPAKAAVGSDDLSARVADWRSAWLSRDPKAYFAFYGADFVPEGMTEHPATGYTADGSKARAAWESQRKQRLAAANGIGIDIQDLVVRTTDAERATTTFRQVYVSDGFSDTVLKTLEWRKEAGVWKIVREFSRPLGGPR